MAIQPTDILSSLTNTQCGQLRDDLVALLIESGIAEPTVRNLKRRLRIGIDHMEDERDENMERDQIEADNLAKQVSDAILSPIRERRNARRQIKYGAD